jgi:hypothetical protein
MSLSGTGGIPESPERATDSVLETALGDRRRS